MGGFVPARPEDLAATGAAQPPSANQGFIPARPQDQGFVPARPEDLAAATPPPQQQPSMVDRAIAGAKAMLPSTVVGGAEGAARTLAGLVDMANKPIIPQLAQDPNAPLIPQIKNATDWVRAHTQATTPGEKLGNFAEGVGELATPAAAEGAAAKGAEAAADIAPKLSESLGGLRNLAKAMESSPIVRAIMGTADHPVAKSLVKAMTGGAKGAAEAGATQGAQAYVKTGGDVDAAEQAGTVGAATGGLLGAGAGAGSSLMESAAEKAGEIKNAIAEATGAPGKFMDSATATLQRAFDRLGFGDKAMPVNDYGQAADQLGQRASSIYDEADRATDGKWREYNADYQAAKATGSKTKIDAARQRLDDLATGSGDANYDQGVREATDRARDAFHDHYTLDTIHNSLVKAFDFGTPETAAMKGSRNVFSGKELGKQLNNLELNPDVGRDRMVELMGDDGYKALHDLSDVAENPAQNQSAKEIVKEVANKAHQTGSKLAWVGGMLGQFLPGGWGKTAGAGYAAGTLLGGGEATANKLLTYIATKPRLTQLLSYAAKRGISPRYASAILGTATNQELQREAEQSQQTQEPQ